MLLGMFSRSGQEPGTRNGAETKFHSLRTEREPYIGMVDCAKRIIDEEGWSTLYRGWWLTMFGCLRLAYYALR